MELVEVSVKKLEDFFISEFGGVQQQLQEFHLRIIQQQHDLRKNQAQIDKLNTEIRKGRGREKKWKIKWEETSTKLSEKVDEMLLVKVKCKELEDRLDKLETSHNQPISCSCSCSTQKGSKDGDDDTNELLNKLSMQFESQFEKWNRRQVGLLHKEVGKLKQVMGGLQRFQRRKYPPCLIPIARGKKDEDVEVLDIKPVLPILSTKSAKATPSECLPKSMHGSASSIWTIPDIDRIRKKWGLPTQPTSDKSAPAGGKAQDNDKQKELQTLPVGDQATTFDCPKCGVQYPSQVECQIHNDLCKTAGDNDNYSSNNVSSPDAMETVDDGDTVILQTFAKPKPPRPPTPSTSSPGNSTNHGPDPNNELACLCRVSFRVKPLVGQHIRYYTMPCSYPCKFCRKRFPYLCNLEAHLRASHNIPRSFSSNISLLGYGMMR